MATSSTLRPPHRVLLHANVPGERRRLSGTGRGRSSRAGSGPGPWPARLRRALQEGTFVLHYQPIVSLADGRLSHHEALLRLGDDPGGPLLAPAAFLGAAESHGVIGEIDRMVIERVAELLGRRRAFGRLAERSRTPIAVNVSALTVGDPGALAFLRGAIERHRLDASELIVEVTETAAIADMRAASEFCSGAEALGCAIALDDFGTGFGSLQYLKQLPFTYLKIDGGFVRGLVRSRVDQLVVRALVAIAEGLGRRTVAEFVADARTLQMLRALGVDYAQGYEVGRPQPTPAPRREIRVRAARGADLSAAAGTGGA